MKYTEQQKEVIAARNCDILVSAGAGSGKTSVLTERILGRLTDPDNPVDIDRILVLTFTRAAAAQMKERLQGKLTAYLIEHPEDAHMQRQETLIHAAQITTIDSFCLYLVRNHFHLLSIDPAFRIADTGEIRLMEQECLGETLEEAYEVADPEFLLLSDRLNPNVKEAGLEKAILDLYRYASSHPYPDRWLGSFAGLDEKSWWQEVVSGLAKDLCGKLSELWERTALLRERSLREGIPESFEAMLQRDLEIMTALKEKAEGLLQQDPEGLYEKAAALFSDFSWSALARTKKGEEIDPDLKERIQKERNLIKKELDTLRKMLVVSEDVAKEREGMALSLQKALSKVTLSFADHMAEKMADKNAYGFSDIEHMALSILIKDGAPTETALSYRDYFAEIMVDEYQDSNQVQEEILSVLAKSGPGICNRFMVGDKKQSIYRFRMAHPAIFNEKYESYQKDGNDHRLLLLNQNFRSRLQVIDSVNRIFSLIMRNRIGGVEYDSFQELVAGADYPDAEPIPGPEGEEGIGYETEVLLAEYDGNRSSRKKAEFALIAERIRQLAGRFPVLDESSKKPALRPASYRDMVILMRSPKDTAQALRRYLCEQGIPAVTSERSGYFAEASVRTMMELLRALENPYHDLSLAAALRSIFFGLTDSDLVLIRGEDKKSPFYTCLQKAAGDPENPVRDRASRILSELSELRTLAFTRSVSELITVILDRYHYGEYLLARPGGEQRLANVEMLLQKAADFEKTSYHGLFWFIRYIDQLEKYQVDEGEAGILSEAADVVRILSIHASKGLEFPIVFVSDCDKEFLQEEQKKTVLADLDLGLSANWIDVQKRLKGKSLRKRQVEEKIEAENLGEELRLLYVAATRAKEKLMFTGCVKSADAAQPCSGVERPPKGQRLAAHLLRAQNTFLKYLLLAAGADPACFVLKSKSIEALEGSQALDAAAAAGRMEELSDFTEPLRIRKELEEEIAEKESGQETGQEAGGPENMADLSEEAGSYLFLRDRFSFVYPHENLSGLYAKTSVSELKHAAMEEEGVKAEFETDREKEECIPAFAAPQKEPGGTRRGSAYHRVLELLDPGSFPELAEEKDDKLATANILQQLQALTERGLISTEETKLVREDRILSFIRSDAAGRMAKAHEAGKLFREQPFVITIPANRVFKEVPEEERVMIQGVIDVFWEEEDGLILLDYKTDAISDPQELIDRYHSQMSYYQEALEQLTGKKVKEKILYSFALVCEVRVQ